MTPTEWKEAQLAQPEQEPVAWITKTGSVWKTKWDDSDIPLYTTQPQHFANARKPLTDEQRKNMGDKYGGKLHRPDSAAYWYFKGIDDTEAAHGIKGDA